MRACTFHNSCVYIPKVRYAAYIRLKYVYTPDNNPYRLSLAALYNVEAKITETPYQPNFKNPRIPVHHISDPRFSNTTKPDSYGICGDKVW